MPDDPKDIHPDKDLPPDMQSPPAIAAGSVTISIREWAALVHLAAKAKRLDHPDLRVWVGRVHEAMAVYRREGVLDTATE